MDGDGRAVEARRLRSEDQLSVRQIQQRLGVSRRQLSEWLRDLSPPAWTRRPNAKDEVRSRAVELRSKGWSVTDIAAETGAAKSTVWRWVRHLPLDPDSERAAQKRAHARLMTEARWSAHRAARDERRAAVMAEASACVGELTTRELLLIGAVGPAAARVSAAHAEAPRAADHPAQHRRGLPWMPGRSGAAQP